MTQEGGNVTIASGGGRVHCWSMCGLLAMGLGVVLGGPQASKGQTFEVKITADNAYLLGYGTVTSAAFFLPPVENCTAAQINSCVTGPETHVLTIPPGNDYLYIVAYSDDAVFQGVMASFRKLSPPPSTFTYTGNLSDNWEVFATDCPFDVCDGPPVGPALNYTGPPNGGCTINEEILIANAGAGGTPSGGWESIPGFSLRYGYQNLPGSPYPVCGLTKFASWMWYSSNGDPFTPGYDHQEYLIFRLPLNDLTDDVVAPAVSVWGVITLLTLLPVGIAIKFGRRRAGA